MTRPKFFALCRPCRKELGGRAHCDGQAVTSHYDLCPRCREMASLTPVRDYVWPGERGYKAGLDLQ